MSRWLEAARASRSDPLSRANSAISANRSGSDTTNPPIGTNGTNGTQQTILPTPLIPVANSCPYGAPANIKDWPAWMKQRHNEILQEGQFTWFQICKLVYSEAIEAWCGQHWKAPSHGRCAACDKSNPEFNCGDGAKVCRQDDYSCLIDYGTQRRLAANRGLSQIGIEVPEGWILPDGSTP